MARIRYLLLAVVSVVFTLVAWLAAPFVTLACRADGTLPTSLKWFETFDSPSCDTGWKEGYYGAFLEPPEGALVWWYRTRWLWRNPAYGFNYWPLGIAFDPLKWTVHVVTFNADSSVSYLYATDTAGNFCEMTPTGGKFGWKMLNYVDHWQGALPVWKTQPWGPQWRTMLAFTPFSFSKIWQRFLALLKVSG